MPILLVEPADRFIAVGEGATVHLVCEPYLRVFGTSGFNNQKATILVLHFNPSVKAPQFLSASSHNSPENNGSFAVFQAQETTAEDTRVKTDSETAGQRLIRQQPPVRPLASVCEIDAAVILENSSVTYAAGFASIVEGISDFPRDVQGAFGNSIIHICRFNFTRNFADRSIVQLNIVSDSVCLS